VQSRNLRGGGGLGGIGQRRSNRGVSNVFYSYIISHLFISVYLNDLELKKRIFVLRKSFMKEDFLYKL